MPNGFRCLEFKSDKKKAEIAAKQHDDLLKEQANLEKVSRLQLWSLT